MAIGRPLDAIDGMRPRLAKGTGWLGGSVASGENAVSIKQSNFLELESLPAFPNLRDEALELGSAEGGCHLSFHIHTTKDRAPHDHLACLSDIANLQWTEPPL